MIGWLVFLISVVPFIELRGAIPLAITIGYDPAAAFAICVGVNLLVIPIAFVILDSILPPVRRRVKFVDEILMWFVRRARKHQNLSLTGLAAFVGVPLPVTGAYTGALLAYILGINRARASLAIGVGVFVAGALITLAALGIIWIWGISP